jgi:hypothetical protein
MKPDAGDSISVFDGTGKKFSAKVITSPKRAKSEFKVNSGEKTFSVKLDVENYRYKAIGCEEGVNEMTDKKKKKKKRKKKKKGEGTKKKKMETM